MYILDSSEKSMGSLHLIPKWPLIYADTNWPLLPRSRKNILLNFRLKNEASRANLNKSKRIFKWRPFWNKVSFAPFFHRKTNEKTWQLCLTFLLF